ncbi:MAG: 50S ribosomal protein L24 [Candidatus Omnitrophica bacterium]|nr:50S ribosomal protein L24 [Candidatus Omnitrophota bacterium]
MRHIKKNDMVFVISGKDKGKTGKVIKVFLDEAQALIQGINFVKKHQRRTQQDQQGGIIQKEMPVSISKLLLVCPKCNKPNRSKAKVLEDGSRLRLCSKCNEIIP